jgi:hypothetical protein
VTTRRRPEKPWCAAGNAATAGVGHGSGFASAGGRRLRQLAQPTSPPGAGRAARRPVVRSGYGGCLLSVIIPALSLVVDDLHRRPTDGRWRARERADRWLGGRCMPLLRAAARTDGERLEDDGEDTPYTDEVPVQFGTQGGRLTGRSDLSGPDQGPAPSGCLRGRRHDDDPTSGPRHPGQPAMPDGARPRCGEVLLSGAGLTVPQQSGGFVGESWVLAHIP